MSRVSDSAVQVVICGSHYGAMYALALSTLPGFRLAGIIARGSQRSVNLAEKMGVPLYKTPDEVRSPVDVACVAVGGNAANELVLAFLRRGIHVVAEHPIGPASMKTAIETARRTGACYHVNAHWGDLPPARAFVEECTRARESSPLIFLTMQTSIRLFYSAMDLVVRVLGPTGPFSPRSVAVLDVPSSIPSPVAGSTWTCATGILGGVPTVFQRSSWIGPRDDGNDFFVGHRISVTFADGRNVLLGEASGPALRFPEFVPDTRFIFPSSQRDSFPGSVQDIVSRISTHAGPMWADLVGGPPATYANHMGIQRLGANQLALRRLWDQVCKGIVAPEETEEHLLATSRLWWRVGQLMRGPYHKNLLWAGLRKMKMTARNFLLGQG